MAQKVIMGAEDISRVLSRVAHEIIERHSSADGLMLVGVHTEGVPLARRLASLIKQYSGSRVAVGALDISLYRDDLATGNPPPAIKRTDIPAVVEGKAIVLVDDVLYTGRSIRAAMDAIVDIGRPRSIKLAILVDRGHRELPIRADFVGKNIPSSRDEEVQVRLVEIDGVDEVIMVDSTGFKHYSGELKKAD